MSVCTNISWLLLVTNADDPGLFLWLIIVTTMIKMTTTTTAMSTPATIMTDTVMMATSSAESVRKQTDTLSHSYMKKHHR